MGNGDDIAGDNVYSCFSPFSATPVTLRLVVAASIDGNSVASPVIVLNIVSPLDNAAAQQVIDGQASAALLAQNAITALGDTLAARLQAAAAIRQLAGVAAAGVASDNTTIWICYASGIEGGLMLNPPGTRGSTQQMVLPGNGTRVSRTTRPTEAQSVPPASFPHYRPYNLSKAAVGASKLAQLTADPQNFVGNSTVLIWNACHSKFAPFDEGPELQALFTGSQCPLYNVT